MLLKFVISGGQTGADLAGLQAAKQCGIKTGGYMCKGFRTVDGDRPEYHTLYQMRELDTTNYAVRTRKNVDAADLTCLFTDRFSPGSKLTRDCCKELNKPCLTLPAHWSGTSMLGDADYVIRELDEYNVRILNIAGHRESVCPGIQQSVYEFLVHTFSKLCGV